jgi:hypothetical protein
MQNTQTSQTSSSVDKPKTSSKILPSFAIAFQCYCRVKMTFLSLFNSSLSGITIFGLVANFTIHQNEDSAFSPLLTAENQTITDVSQLNGLLGNVTIK